MNFSIYTSNPCPVSSYSPRLSVVRKGTVFEAEAAKGKEKSLEATGNSGCIDSAAPQMLQDESLPSFLTYLAGGILQGPFYT